MYLNKAPTIVSHICTIRDNNHFEKKDLFTFVQLFVRSEMVLHFYKINVLFFYTFPLFLQQNSLTHSAEISH